MSQEKRKNHPDSQADPDLFPCPICGDTNFYWGYTTGHTSSGFRFRRNDDEKFTHGKWVKARECARCGNLQLFTRDRSGG